MSDKCRVAVVDDLPLYRAGVIQALVSTGYIEIVGEGSSPEDAIRIARDLKPDVLFFDAEKSTTMTNAIGMIISAAPAVRIVVLTRCDLDDDVDACLEAGVRGYLLKATSGDELARVVSCVRDGQSYVTPHLAARLLSRHLRSKTRHGTDLSIREEAVLSHVSRGLTNKEIARNLHVSEKTVKHHMTKVMQKLRVRSRTEAALFLRNRPIGTSSMPFQHA